MMMMVLMLILDYLIGVIPNGYVIGEVFLEKDIGEFGSGNTGATNNFRVLGKPAGFIVTFLGIFRGFITVFFPLWFPVHTYGPISTFFTHGLVIGIFAIIGRAYPIYLKFKRGKAVVASAEVVLGISPILLLVLAIIFFGILYLTKYVSLPSIIAAINCVMGSLVIHDCILSGMSAFVSIILIFRRRSNIVRIFKGEEPKIKWM